MKVCDICKVRLKVFEMSGQLVIVPKGASHVFRGRELDFCDPCYAKVVGAMRVLGVTIDDEDLEVKQPAFPFPPGFPLLTPPLTEDTSLNSALSEDDLRKLGLLE